MAYNSINTGAEIQAILDSVAGKYVKPSTGIPASDLAPDVFLQGEKGDKGDKGDTGATGPQGPQGVSVTSVVQTTTSSADGGSNVMTVTMSNGTKSTFTVKNGSKGSQGEQGPKGDKGDKGDTGATGANGTNGANGATFTPSVDDNGNLSWTNNGGLTNPPTVNIKGPKGDAGEGGGGNTEGISMKVETIAPSSDSIAFLGTDYRPAMKPNTIYVQAEDSVTKGGLLRLSIDALEETSDAYAEYVIIFIFNSSMANEDLIALEVPSNTKWANGEVPTLEANVVYELNIARSVVAGQVSYNAVLTPFKAAE